MLCACTGHSREEIEKMMTGDKYESLADFQDDTFVGTGCGRCLPEVDKLFSNLG